MILTYKEALEKYETEYTLNRALKNKILYKIEKGIYSINQYFINAKIIRNLKKRFEKKFRYKM